MTDKVLFVGAANPPQMPEGQRALVGSLTWKRLAHIMDVHPDDLASLVDTTNLMQTWPEGKDPFHGENARKEVGRFLNVCRQEERKWVILLGPKIAKAFGYTWSESNDFFKFRSIEGMKVVVVPNPLSDWWKGPTNGAKGSEFLRMTIGITTHVG